MRSGRDKTKGLSSRIRGLCLSNYTEGFEPSQHRGASVYIRTYIFLVVVYLFAVTVAFLIFSGARCVPVSSVFLLVLAWSRFDAVHHRSHLCPVPTPYSSYEGEA